MYIDFKETIWYRIDISEDTIDKLELIKALQDGTVQDAADLLGWYNQQAGKSAEGEYILDTGEQMKPGFAQEGHATLQVFNAQHELVYSNGKIEEKNGSSTKR